MLVADVKVFFGKLKKVTSHLTESYIWYIFVWLKLKQTKGGCRQLIVICKSSKKKLLVSTQPKIKTRIMDIAHYFKHNPIQICPMIILTVPFKLLKQVIPNKNNFWWRPHLHKKIEHIFIRKQQVAVNFIIAAVAASSYKSKLK